MTEKFKEKLQEFRVEVFAPVKYLAAKVFQTRFFRFLFMILLFIPNLVAKKIPYQKRKIMWGVVFILPFLVGLVYFFIIPFVMTIVYSFSYVNNTIEEGFTVKPIGILNYKYVFEVATYTNASFMENIATNVLSIFSNFIIVLIFSLLMAVVLNSKFRGRAFVRAVFFMPIIFNSQAIDIAMTAATDLKGFVEGQTSELFESMFSFARYIQASSLPPFLTKFLVTAMTKIQEIINFSGVQILIFLAAIQSVPRHLYEAAQMEGATKYEMFWKITFPMVSPMMLPAAVYTIVDSFMRSNILKYIGQFNNASKSKMPFNGKEFELSNYGINAAMSLIFAFACLLVITIVVLVLRKLVFYNDRKN